MLVRWSVRWSIAVLALGLAALLGSGLFQIMQQDLLPSDDVGLLRGSVQTATGTSFDQYLSYSRQVAAIVEKDPNVADVQSDESGELNIALKPLSERKLSADQVAVELRAKSRGIPGTSVTIDAPGDHSNDGTHTIHYYSTDKAGNTETAHSFTVKLDTTAPSSGAALPPGGPSRWYVRPATPAK